MNFKKLLAASILATFMVPALAAAYTYDPSDYPAAREMLVEGHTVFAVIEANICVDENDERVACPKKNNVDADLAYDVRANVTMQRMGAAVAVLVRDRVKEVPPLPGVPQCPSNKDLAATIFYENPGVLWFNDQFLVGDDLDILEVEADANVDVCAKSQSVTTNFGDIPWRYPCGGWIFATQGGNPDPRGFMTYWQYVESYFITDPNDHTWTIDKFAIAPLGFDLEPVFQQLHPSGGGHSLEAGPVNASETPWTSPDNAHWMYYLGAFNMWSVPILGYDQVDPGATSGSSCDPHEDTASADPYETQAVKYNAVLFFFFEDLATSFKGFKRHGEGGANNGDRSFCEASTTEWACGPGGDDAEGNSHPYNDQETGSGPNHTHGTAAVDLYFSNDAPPTPVLRNYAVYDTTGSAAPRHYHDPNESFDDRIRLDPCVDADYYVEKSSYTVNGGGTGSGDEYESYEGEGRYGDGQQMDGSNTDDCTYS